MSKVRCMICTHPKTAEIDKALSMPGASVAAIARMYGVSLSTMSSHQKECVAHFLIAAEAAVRVERGLNVKETVFKGSDMLHDLLNACHNWLRDPENPLEYNLDPRDNEINVVYLDHNMLDGRGNPTRRTDTLRALLERVSTNGIDPQWTKASSVDVREYTLKTIGKLTEMLEFYARLCGMFQKERENEHDERAKFERELDRVMAEGWDRENAVAVVTTADTTGRAAMFLQ